MTPVRFELAAPRSRVKHSNTEQLHSLHLGNGRPITPLLLNMHSHTMGLYTQLPLVGSQISLQEFDKKYGLKQ